MGQGTGVRFELERLALEGDELVISGFWTGTDGMRFVRPTLLSEDRRILATLEHKPWVPSGDAPWTAAFPWTGGIAVDAGSLALAVAPRVIVPLGETATGAPTAAEPSPPPDSAQARQPVVAAAAPPAATAAKPAPAAKPPAAAKPKPKPAPVAKPKPAPVAKPKPKPKPAPAVTPTPVPAARPARRATAAPAQLAPVVLVDERSDDLARALAAAERDRERALTQLAEAVEARKAAARATAKLEIGHAEALAARDAAEAALARAEAERQEAVLQRDEVLVAYRTLQRQLQAERADADREAHRRTDAQPEPDPDPEPEPEPDPDSGEPLGVRTLPAVRSIRAELQLPPRAPKRRLAKFDLFVVRVIGLAAAGCFIAMLVSIVRVIS